MIWRSTATYELESWLWDRGAEPLKLPAGWIRSFSPNAAHAAHQYADDAIQKAAQGNRAAGTAVQISMLEVATGATQQVAIASPNICSQCDAPLPSIAGWSPSGDYYAFADYQRTADSTSSSRVDYLWNMRSLTLTRIAGRFVTWDEQQDIGLITRCPATRRCDNPSASGIETVLYDAVRDEYQFVRDTPAYFVGASEIAFSWNEGARSGIALVDLKTNEERRWPATSISRRGDRLMLAHLDRPGCNDFVVLGADLRELRCAEGTLGFWSPDGRTMAIVDGAICQLTEYAISTVKVDTGQTRLLGKVLAYRVEVNWSNDSRYLIVEESGCGQ